MVIMWFYKNTGVREPILLVGKDAIEIPHIFKCNMYLSLCVPLLICTVLETILNLPNNISQKKIGKFMCKLSAYGLSILWLICDKLVKTNHQLLIAITNTFVMPAYVL